MNLVILHFHLNRGGVMQVIARHLQALSGALAGQDPLRVALVYGGRREGWPDDLPGRLPALDVVYCEVPEIDYGQGGAGDVGPLADRLQTTLVRAGFPPRTTVIHSHNHALGKNLALPGVLAHLAEVGYPLLLQIHDFAEDFRPDTFQPLCQHLAGGDVEALGRVLYPQAGHIHYAVLNSRDARILERASFDPARVHLLPNPVPDFGPLPERAGARAKMHARFGVAARGQLFLYPVRGITRKNLGEMLLWSALAGARAEFGTTLPPLNPEQQPIYRGWRALATELGLRCVFETGMAGGLTFTENLAAADQMLTTSLAEGFGMVFLESWLTQRPLVGRDLAEITGDFVRAGVRLDTLEPRVAIPASWLGREVLLDAWETTYGDVLAQYRRAPIDRAQLRRQMELLVEDDRVDFGVLSARLQARVIREVHANQGRRRHLLRQNAWLDEALTGDPGVTAGIVQHNAGVVRQGYGLPASGRRLIDLYRQILTGGGSDWQPQPAASGSAILDAFLNFARFRPLRNER